MSVDVLFSFAGKEKSTKKETSRLHSGLLKFVLWLCLCCPAMLMPHFFGYLGFIWLFWVVRSSSQWRKNKSKQS
jgi:hypothetical protein